jgi:hypothetical protein
MTLMHTFLRDPVFTRGIQVYITGLLPPLITIKQEENHSTVPSGLILSVSLNSLEIVGYVIGLRRIVLFRSIFLRAFDVLIPHAFLIFCSCKWIFDLYARPIYFS